MGTCISKCTKPKKNFKGDLFIHVQDKLVVSQDPVPPKTTVAIPPETGSSSSSTTTTNYSSHYSCSTDRSTDKRAIKSSSSTSTSPISTSCSSALLSAKDRSFSDEFLWSCARDNPHVIGLKEKQYFTTSGKIHYHHPQNIHPSLRTKSTNHVPAPRKRPRSSSPTLPRQKSFRKEHDHNPGLPNRGLRSPSPSRRYNNVAYNSAVSSYPRRETFRSPSSDNLIGRDSSARKRDALISKHVSTKIDDRVAVGDSRDMDVVVEDIDNPLIALDCFIFL